MSHNDSNASVKNVMGQVPTSATRRRGLVSAAVVVAALVAASGCVQLNSPGTTLPSPRYPAPAAEKDPRPVKEHQEELPRLPLLAKRNPQIRQAPRRAIAPARRLVSSRPDPVRVLDILRENDSESEADPDEGSDSREPAPADDPPDEPADDSNPYVNPAKVSDDDVNSHGGYADPSGHARARTAYRVLRRESKYSRYIHHPTTRPARNASRPPGTRAKSRPRPPDWHPESLPTPSKRGARPSPGRPRYHPGRTPRPMPRVPSRGRRR
jgi:hypothetical protein